MKLTIILIYQIISHKYHVLQTATKITKDTTGYKPLHRTIIQFSKYATTTTKNSSPPPPRVQWPISIIKSQMVEKVEQHVYSHATMASMFGIASKDKSLLVLFFRKELLP